MSLVLLTLIAAGHVNDYSRRHVRVDTFLLESPTAKKKIPQVKKNDLWVPNRKNRLVYFITCSDKMTTNKVHHLVLFCCAAGVLITVL